MNLTLLTADIVRRIPAMAKDSPHNNEALIRRLLNEELTATILAARNGYNQGWDDCLKKIGELCREQNVTLVIPGVVTATK